MTVLMATPPTKAAHTTLVTDEPLWRISVEQYHQMSRSGILMDGDPVELLEGLLITKVRKTPPHSAVTGLIRSGLQRLRLTNWHIDSHAPITTRDSEPEPDVTIVRGDILDYLDRHPGPQDTVLVIEVADATLRRDRGIKKRLYARAGIPVYWIVNLNQLQIEVYSQPDQTAAVPDYRQQQVYQGVDQVPVIWDGIEVGQLLVSDVLPPQLAKQGEE